MHIIATPEKTTRINYAAYAVLVVFSSVAIFYVRKATKNGRWLRGDQMKRKRLIFAYHDFIKQGKYNSAHTVLQLLIRKKVVLGLGDDDFEVEKLAYKIGLTVSYGYRYNSTHIYLQE